MNQVNADGSKNYVHNPDPSFFDISRVFRPADKTGYTLKKVAHVYEIQSSAELGETADDLASKGAAIRKLSDIYKIVQGKPVASASSLGKDEEDVIRHFKDYISPKLSSIPFVLPMDELLRYQPAEVLSTVSSLGMKLSSAEFLDYMASQLMRKRVKLAGTLIDRVVAAQPLVLCIFNESPSLFDEILKTGALNESVDRVVPELQEVLKPYAVKRAQVGEMLYRRLVPEGIGVRPDAAPTTDMLTYTDPKSGRAYQTTRGAAIDARDAQTHADIGRTLGGGALMLGGYKLLTMHPALRPWKLPLALGAGALGYHALKPGGHSQYKTDEGFNIPAMTEFASQKDASDNVTGVVVGLVEDQVHQHTKTAAYDENAIVSHLLRCASVDNIRGVELSLDSTAVALGRIISS